jgi:hypothetical protein
MNNSCVEVLPAESLKAILARAPMGDMAETHVCNIEWSDGKITKSYLKRFSRNTWLSLVNEVTGYIIAKGCGLPTAKYAALIKPSPTAFKNDMHEWCFVVSGAPGENPASFYKLKQTAECTALMNLVAGWNKVSETIAFDDWTANQDRHLGNILVAGKNDIFLIDHGNLPITIDWQAIQLDPHFQSENKLAYILWKLNCAPLPVKSRIAKASKEHIDVFATIKKELLDWWDILLVNDQPRRQALEHFITARAQLGSERISKNFNMLAV